MARRTKAEAERTRLRILRTSLDVFLKKGYERTTFEDVAARIGLSKGAVYWHFKNKPALLMALVEHVWARQEGTMVEVGRPGSLEGLRDEFVERAERWMRRTEGRKLLKLMTQMDWSSRQARPVAMTMATHDKGLLVGMERALGELQAKGRVRDGVDVKLAAAVLTTMWLGLLKAKVNHGKMVDLPRAIGFGFDMAIAAMGPGKGEGRSGVAENLNGRVNTAGKTFQGEKS